MLLGVKKNFDRLQDSNFFLEHFFRSRAICRNKRGGHTMCETISFATNACSCSFSKSGTPEKCNFQGEKIAKTCDFSSSKIAVFTPLHRKNYLSYKKMKGGQGYGRSQICKQKKKLESYLMQFCLCASAPETAFDAQFARYSHI